MDRLDYYLVKIAEEGGEVTQAAAKCLRFGLKEVEPGKDCANNLERLRREVVDVIAAWETMCAEAGVSQYLPPEEIQSAKAKSHKWLEFTIELGRLE